MGISSGAPHIINLITNREKREIYLKKKKRKIKDDQKLFKYLRNYGLWEVGKLQNQHHLINFHNSEKCDDIVYQIRLFSCPSGRSKTK